MIILICCFSIFISLIHSTDEVIGDGAPIWKNFGKITGTCLPDYLGFLFFTVALTIGLIILSVLGYYFDNKVALSLLLGARMGDTIISHWWLWYMELNNPNPGLGTTPVTAGEAVMILYHCTGIIPGFVLIGIFFFALVLPSLWLVGRIVPNWRNQ